MSNVALAVIVAVFAASEGRSVEPPRFSPAALRSRPTGGKHAEQVISVFPPGGKEFEISLPWIPRWFAFGRSGRSVYATAVREIGPKSFTDQRGMFKVELEPVRVSTIAGLDAFYSIAPFAVSQSEDFIVFDGAKGNYPAGSCGAYKLDLPTGDIRPVIETSDCLAGSPWRVLSLSPEGTEALILANRRLALLDLERASIMKLEGWLTSGSFSPDGKWIAALEVRNPKPPRTILIDRTDLARRRDLGRASNNQTVWSPDSKVLLQTVWESACPNQNPLALETVEVQTGNRSLIKNSICHCDSSGHIGWVRSDLRR